MNEALVLLLKVRNVLGCLAEDSGLVELVGWCESAEVLVDVFFHAFDTRLFQAVDHDAQSWYGVTKSGDLIVEVGTVALLDHVVRGLLGRRAVAASGRRRRGR